MEKYQTVEITDTDLVGRKFKNLIGYAAVIHADGVEVEFKQPISKSGQNRLFFRFDQLKK